MKVIQLKSNGIGRYEDVSPFIITDNKLTLKIVLPPMSGEFYLSTENGEISETILLPRDGVITLENLRAGELCAEVKHYFRGELIKRYQVEPLVLKEADSSLLGTPEIAALRRDLTMLEETLAAEREMALKREYELDTANKNLSALIRFAYADYRANVYLGGGSVEKFINEFGLDLTEEQKKEIFGGMENDEN